MIKLDIEANTFDELLRQIEKTLGVKLDLVEDARLPLDLPKLIGEARSTGTTSKTGSEEHTVATTEKPKRTRRTRAQIEADEKQGYVSKPLHELKESEKPASPESKWAGGDEEDEVSEIEVAPPIAENKEVTLEDCKALVRKIIGPDEKGIPAAAKLNVSFGIRKVVDLADKPATWPKFYAAGMKVLNEITT